MSSPTPIPGKCGKRCRDGGYCTNPAGKRTDHVGYGACYRHFGCTPAANIAAARQAETVLARTELARLGEPEPIGHPVIELLAVAARRKKWRDIIEARLLELRELTSTDKLGVERERALVALYERAMRDEEQAYTGLARLDLDARLVRVEERQVELVGRAVDVMLARVVPAGLHAECREVLAAELAKTGKET